MKYQVIALRDLLNEGIQERDYQKKIVDCFSCPLNLDIEYFVRDKAIEFEKMDISRTYFIYTSFQGRPQLVGFFAVALKPIHIRRGVRKCITGNTGREEASVFLLGQLGKNYKGEIDQQRLIKGEQLIYLAFKKILEAYQIIGGRAVLVECQNEEHLKNFYESMGFEQVDADGTDGLIRYYINIENILLDGTSF
jgi:hypothetical protein